MNYYLVDIDDAIFLDENDERCSLIGFLDSEIIYLYEQKYYYSHMKNGYLKDVSKLKIIDDEIRRKINELKVPKKIAFSFCEHNPIEGITYILEPVSQKIFRVDDTLIQFKRVNSLKANKRVLTYTEDEINALNTYIKNISFNYIEDEDINPIKKARIIKFPKR